MFHSNLQSLHCLLAIKLWTPVQFCFSFCGHICFLFKDTLFPLHITYLGWLHNTLLSKKTKSYCFLIVLVFVITIVSKTHNSSVWVQKEHTFHSQFVVSIIMRISTLLALATCLLQFFQPAESVAPLVVLGGVAASVKIAGYLQGLWKTHTKNHCWPKNIDAGFYCSYNADFVYKFK